MNPLQRFERERTKLGSTVGIPSDEPIPRLSFGAPRPSRARDPDAACTMRPVLETGGMALENAARVAYQSARCKDGRVPELPLTLAQAWDEACRESKT